MAIVGAFVPEVYDIDAQEQKFLVELVNKHEGRLRFQGLPETGPSHEYGAYRP
jgi:hypothetical protein